MIKSTYLTDSFNFTEFYSCYGDSALPLVYIKNEKVFIYTRFESIPSSGIELISLLPIAAQNLAKKRPEKLKQALQEPLDQEYEPIKTLISNLQY